MVLVWKREVKTFRTVGPQTNIYYDVCDDTGHRLHTVMSQVNVDRIKVAIAKGQKVEVFGNHVPHAFIGGRWKSLQKEVSKKTTYFSHFAFKPANSALYDGGGWAHFGPTPEKGGQDSRGVFATRAMTAHRRVCLYVGDMLHGAAFNKDRDRPYAFFISAIHGCMDPACRERGKGNVLRRKYAKAIGAALNEPHKGQAPNCMFVMMAVKGVPFLVPHVFTTRCIRVGEELTIDYGEDYERTW